MDMLASKEAMSGSEAMSGDPDIAGDFISKRAGKVAE